MSAVEKPEQSQKPGVTYHKPETTSVEADHPASENRARRGPPQEIHTAYLGLGSNIAPEANLVKAMELIRQHMPVEAISNAYETPAVGSSGPNFINAAILVRTPLTPGLLKSLVLRGIEVQLGRMRTANKNAPRTIDLDILVFDGQLMDPKVWTHAFVAVPLAELLPGYTHPNTRQNLQEVARRLAHETTLKLREDVSLGET